MESKLQPSPTVPVIRVQGNAYDRGHQRGRQLATLIRSRVSRAAGASRAAPGNQLEVLADALERSLETFQPGVLAEYRGIAAGADIPWSEMRAVMAGRGGPRFVECSCFAATGLATRDGQLVLGKNGDLRPPSMTPDDLVVIEVVPETGHPYVTMGTLPEQPAQPDGINGAGLVVVGCGQQVVDDGRAARNDGLPLGPSVYDTLHSVLRDCSTVKDAVDQFSRTPRGYTGRTMIIGDASGCWAKIEVTYNATWVHTVPTDSSQPTDHVAAGVSGAFEGGPTRHQVTGEAVNPAPYERYRQYMGLLAGASGRIDETVAQDLLRDHGPGAGPASICKHGETQTLESFVIKPQERRVWVTVGSPCAFAYTEVPLTIFRSPQGPENLL